MYIYIYICIYIYISAKPALHIYTYTHTQPHQHLENYIYTFRFLLRRQGSLKQTSLSVSSTLLQIYRALFGDEGFFCGNTVIFCGDRTH